MANPQLIDQALKVGALKAKKVADGVLQRVREKLGY
jgi:tryptophanyl-tRNA synthetase